MEHVIGDCAVYEDGHRPLGKVSLEQASDLARSTPGFVWISLRQPRAQDMARIAQEFGLPPIAVEDAAKAHQRPKLEVYAYVVFLLLKTVRYVDHDQVVEVTELAIFLAPKFVVATVRNGESDVLDRVQEELDKDNSTVAQHGPPGVLYRTVDLVVDGYEEAINDINSDIDTIEFQVFGSGEPGDHAQRIHKLKREIAEFRRAVQPLAAPMQGLAEGDVPGIDQSAAPHSATCTTTCSASRTPSKATTGCCLTCCRPIWPASPLDRARSP